MMIVSPRLTLTLEVRAEVGEPIEVGNIDGGRRRIVPIIGGTFDGRGELEIRGRIRPGGADWQLIHPDGLTEADARYALETDRGQTVVVRNRGLRHAPADVMRRLLSGERWIRRSCTSSRRQCLRQLRRSFRSSCARFSLVRASGIRTKLWCVSGKWTDSFRPVLTRVRPVLTACCYHRTRM